MTNRTFARRLRYAREVIRQITQTELAKLTGIDATVISHYERLKGTREPSIDSIIKLAKALDVSADFLLGLDDGLLKYEKQLPLIDQIWR